jgi:hypothetical protein
VRDKANFGGASDTGDFDCRLLKKKNNFQFDCLI